MLKSIKAFIFGAPAPAPAPAPVVVHTLLYPENEIAVIETVDGFILQRVKTGEYYCLEGRSGYGHHLGFSTWEASRRSLPGARQYERTWYVVKFDNKQNAISKAIELEKAADKTTAEAERRKNFVERKVWR